MNGGYVRDGGELISSYPCGCWIVAYPGIKTDFVVCKACAARIAV